MRRFNELLVRIAAGALALVLLGGCVATETTVASRGVIVNGPPPPPLPETQRPQPPGPAAAWVAGYWHWTGMQYACIPGHWDENAPPGAKWAAPQYVTADGAYYYQAGGYRQERGTANALR